MRDRIAPLRGRFSRLYAARVTLPNGTKTLRKQDGNSAQPLARACREDSLHKGSVVEFFSCFGAEYVS